MMIKEYTNLEQQVLDCPHVPPYTCSTEELQGSASEAVPLVTPHSQENVPQNLEKNRFLL